MRARSRIHEESDVLRVWGRVLCGHTPFLSIEITKECPLRCPGCYAYSPDDLGAVTALRQLSDYRGQDLVTAALALVRRVRPVPVSIVGGEPLVRYRELCDLLPWLDRMGIEVRLVTSAVRPIPEEWTSIGSLHVVVSIDGLAPEHDRRRAPATYDRILQMLARPAYLADFCRFWSDRPEVRTIWFSIYTPQEGENSPDACGPKTAKYSSSNYPRSLRNSREYICRAWSWKLTGIRLARPASVLSPV